MRRATMLHLLATVVTLLGTLRIVVMPWFHGRAGRGDYLWGHYSLEEIYVGAPLLLFAVVFTLLWLVPLPRRPKVATRMLILTGSSLLAVACFDFLYAFVLRGAWQPQFWLDSEHISRADNDPDPDFGFVRKPHAQWRGVVPGTDRVVEYRADADGFRNPDSLVAADLVFVGDSYTEAAQVPVGNSFPALVGARLQKSTANLGRGAYGPQQEALVIERFALRLHPKVVVWQWFDGNDLGDAEQFAAWSLGEGGAVPLRERYFGNSFFQPLLHSTFDSKKGLFARQRRDDGSILPITVRYHWMPHQTRMRARGWTEAERALRRGVAKCREAGIEVLVVFVPVAARVLHDRITYLDPKDAQIFAPEDAAGVDDFGSALMRSCRELGVGFVDLTEPFVGAAASAADGIYIPRDEHLDFRGHELVADAICTWLAAQR